jgi:Tn3 transposase DDE domain-containing protein
MPNGGSVNQIEPFDVTTTSFGELSRLPSNRLHDQALRREINDGLNVVEHWNSANDFIFFARRGEFSSNRREDQELSMLSLHLLQNCMVYVNTLMVQQVLTRPEWKGRLTPRDLHALTPLFWGHVNPYGRFDLDMRTRLDLN